MPGSRGTVVSDSSIRSKKVLEEWKWRAIPVWPHDGLVCTGETYKSVVKLTFAKGARLKDPKGLFNSSLEGNVGRAIGRYEATKSRRPHSKRSSAGPSHGTAPQPANC